MRSFVLKKVSGSRNKHEVWYRLQRFRLDDHHMSHFADKADKADNSKYRREFPATAVQCNGCCITCSFDLPEDNLLGHNT